MTPIQIFPRHPESPDTYFIDGAWAPACITAKDKRFSEAELAAEFYKAVTDFHGAAVMHDLFNEDDTKQALNEAREWMFAMEHFATLDHHDADPA